MYERILVAVDSSPTSERALEAAIRLALDAQAQLRVVHAVDTVSLNLGVEFPVQADVTESLVRHGQAILRHAETIAAAAGIAAETKLVTIDTLGQRIAEAIAQEAQTWPADLVVVGTHGRRGLSCLFLGSVAEGIARIADTPVLLIRGT